jgi:hypothetical protein
MVKIRPCHDATTFRYSAATGTTRSAMVHCYGLIARVPNKYSPLSESVRLCAAYFNGHMCAAHTCDEEAKTRYLTAIVDVRSHDLSRCYF